MTDPKKLEKLLQKILAFRLRKFTNDMIGARVGLSRERIRQLVNQKMTPKDKKKFYSIKLERKPTAQRVQRICPICKKKEMILPSIKQKTCSRKCGSRLVQKHNFKQAPDGLTGDARIKWLYNNDKNFKKLHASRMHTRWLRLKANKKKYKAWIQKQNIYTKRYLEKHNKGKVITELPK